MHRRIVIRGTGSVHPPLVPHEVLLALHPHRKNGEVIPVEKAARFVRERLGFETHAVGYNIEREMMPPEWLDSSMQVRAGKMALETAGWDPKEVDLLVVMTSTPDFIRFPYQSGIVKVGLNLREDCYCINVDEGCGGFAHSLEFIKLVAYAGYRRVLITAANCYSAFMALKDEEYCFQSNLNVSVFGDGGAAVCLEAIETSGEIGLIANYTLEHDKDMPMQFLVGGCRQPIAPGTLRTESQYIMHGNTVASLAPSLMAEAYRGLMGLHEFDLQKINMLIPHQANPGAIMRDLATPLGIPEEKVWLGGRRVGNVAVACLPFGLDECIRGGRIKAGSAVALVAIGAGGNAWTGGASLWII